MARRAKAAEPAPGLFGAPPEPVPHYHGHRARLKARFADHGAAAMPDYELLELVLFNASPRADVKPLAKRLIAAFGDFNHVVTAQPARLMEVEGIGEAAVHQLRLIAAAAERLARTRVIGQEVLGSWSAVMAYCKTAMAHDPVEAFRLLFLDHRNRLIVDEVQGRGTVNTVPVHVREVVKRALELGASAVIMVHNHPSGDPTPSKADIDLTRRVKQALSAVDIKLHDHLIIGRQADASFVQLGLL